MFRRLTKAVYYGAALLEYIRDYKAPVPPVAADDLVDLEDDELDQFNEPSPDPWLDETLDDVLDCTGTIHRRYCRKFDREVKELYWLAYDEVTEPGNYIRFEGGFHVPQNVIIGEFEGQMMELDFRQELKPSALRKKAAYLGPMPRTPIFLEKMYEGELHD